MRRFGVFDSGDSSPEDYNVREFTDSDTSSENHKEENIYYSYQKNNKLKDEIETLHQKNDNLQRKNDELKDTVKELQQSETFLRYSLEQTERTLNHSEPDYDALLPKVCRLENLSEEKLREIENLRAQVYCLHSQVDEGHKALTFKDEEIQELKNQSQADIRTLTEALTEHQKHVEVLNEQNIMLAADLTEIKTVLQKLSKNDLRASVQDLHDKSLQDNNDLRASVQDLRCLNLQDNNDLRAAVQDLQDQVMKALEIIMEKTVKIDEKRQFPEEHYEIISDLKKSLTDLKSQQETMQEDMLESLQAEIRKTHAQQLEAQKEIENLRAQVCCLQSQQNEAHKVLLSEDEKMQEWNEQKNVLIVELTDVKSVLEKLNKDNNDLRAAVQVLQDQSLKDINNVREAVQDLQGQSLQVINDLRAAVQVHQDQEITALEIIKQKTMEVAGKRQITQELYEITSALKESFTVFTTQQEIKQDKMLESIQTEICKTHAQEHQQLEAEREIDNWRAQVRCLQPQENEAHEEVLNEQKTILTADLTEVKNVLDKLYKDNNDLRAAVQDLQENKGLRAAVQVLQDQSLKDINNLREAVQDLQGQSLQVINDLRAAMQVHQDQEIKALEIIKQKTIEVAEKRQITEELYDITSALKESFTDFMTQQETKQEKMLESIQTEICKTHAQEHQQLEAKREIDNWREQVCSLQSQVNEAHDALAHKDEEIQKLITQSHSEITLTEEPIGCQKHEEVLNEQKTILMADLTEVKNVLDKLYKDNNDLRAAVQDLQENKDLRAAVEVLQDQSLQHINNLREAVQDLQGQSLQVINDLMTVQVHQDQEIKALENIKQKTMEVAEKRQITQELYEITSALKESFTVFTTQQEIKQEKMLESIQAEICKTHAQEHQQLEAEREIDNWREQVGCLQSQVNEAHDALAHKDEEIQKLINQSQADCFQVNKDLRAVVQALQDQVIQDVEIIMQKTTEIAEKRHFTEEHYEIIKDLKNSLTALTGQQEIKLEEMRELLQVEIRKTHAQEHEAQREIESLRAQVCFLKSEVDKSHEALPNEDEEIQEPINQSNTELRSLSEALVYLQKHEEVLNEQKNMLTADLTEVKNVLEKLYKDNHILRVAVQDLQGQSLQDNKDLRADVQVLQDQVMKDVEIIRQKTIEIAETLNSHQEIKQEDIMESIWTEIGNAQEHHTLVAQREIEDLRGQLDKAYEARTHKVEEIKELKNQSQAEIRTLEEGITENNLLLAAMHDLQDQAIKALANITIEIAKKWQTIKEHVEIISDLKKTLSDLKNQQDITQDVEILESLHTKILTSNAEDHQQVEAPVAEPEHLEALAEDPERVEAPAEEPGQREAPAEEPGQLEGPADDPEQLVAEAPEHLETFAEERELLEAPIQVPRWCRYAKCLLNGLPICIATVGILIPSAFLAVYPSTHPVVQDFLCHFQLIQFPF
ncbi:hypothetical protein JOB18_048367 [Solea senegalensis]|uniref:Uncharacterized protein n=1 Tax=Solea senegalensis TaxID=28829 RepID=A0AAV6QQH3_SOLSE|nr:hypothetical protein JOB18_048367 [Solea senegalensis]